jgi:hypothetical protein
MMRLARHVIMGGYLNPPKGIFIENECRHDHTLEHASQGYWLIHFFKKFFFRVADRTDPVFGQVLK